MNKHRVHDLALLVGSCCSTANRHSLSIKSIPSRHPSVSVVKGKAGHDSRWHHEVNIVSLNLYPPHEQFRRKEIT